MPDTKEFWPKLIKAVGAEPREVTTIPGASGIEHEVLGLGVDDKGGRLVIISGDHDARVAAMMQVDVAATLPGKKVIVARPIALALPAIAEALISLVGTPEIELMRLGDIIEKTKEQLKGPVEPIVQAFSHVPVNFLGQVLSAINQLTYIDLINIKKKISEMTEEEGQSVKLNLTNLAKVDLAGIDRALGICGLPFYSFSEKDWAAFDTGNSDDVTESLRNAGILQYFYPSPDQTALSLVDRGIHTSIDVIEQVQALPEMGHPFGQAEILSDVKLIDVVDALMDRKLVVQGEHFLEITDQGKVFRSQIKFQPREGVVSKILKKLGLTINVNNNF